MPANASNIKLFISYRNVEASKKIARTLAANLKQKYNYQVFIDQEELKGGDIWQRKIFDNIRDSDVLIVLLEEETANSEWVQREVDVARGAHVAILPLRIVDEEITVGEIQDKLALTDMQFIHFVNSDENYETLLESVERLSKQTRDNQKVWMQELALRRRVRRAPNNKSHAIFRLGDHPCKVHLATGDMTQLPDIDVLVNSENDYMQMAHIFTTASLSSSIRHEGAHFQQGRLIADTIQQDLNAHIMQSSACGLPVMLAQVIPTHAGHPESNLVKINHARYVFHAAAVRAEIITMHSNLQPIQTDDGIKQVVWNCLNLAHEIDQKQGVISPPESEGHQAEVAASKKYEPIKSIGFPVFGTGQGGRSVLEVVGPMVEAFRTFLLQHEQNLTLERIHLCVFSENDIGFVENALSEHFDRVKA